MIPAKPEGRASKHFTFYDNIKSFGGCYADLLFSCHLSGTVYFLSPLAPPRWPSVERRNQGP